MNEEEIILDQIGNYLSYISSVEDCTEISPEQREFCKAVEICDEILKRTSLISRITIERPDEFKEVWEEDKPEFDYMPKYAISNCEIADEVIKKIRG